MERRGEIFDADGNLIDADVVPDGGRMVVGIRFLDGRVVLRDADGDDDHPRPGRLFVHDGPAETAYAAYKQRLADAWKQPETSRRLIDTADFAEKVTRGLLPIPSSEAEPVTDAAMAQSQRLCAEAHARYADRISNAWRTP